MNKANHVPHDWETIEGQVREAILCQLSILQTFGPNSPELARLYLGIDPDCLESLEVKTEEDYAAVLASIPLDRHHLHYLARNAYTYAYQLEGWEQASPENHYEARGAMAGFPQSDMHGNLSPLSSESDAPLRRVFDTFIARWQLYSDDYSVGLSVRELALLSNMTVPAVRTSLSKEGFKLDMTTSRREAGRRDDDKAATLNNDDALIWLSRRRGFVPNRVARPQPSNAAIADFFEAADLSFDQALRKAMSALQMDTIAFADMISSSQEWVDKLASGGAADIDIPALRASARVLAVPEPEFVARAVHHLIDCDMAHINKGPA